MAYPKPVRIKDARLKRQLREHGCMRCGSKPCDIDHLRSVGAGGDDSPNNIWPLCRNCHILRHQMGLKAFVEENHLPVSFEDIYPKLMFSWR
jgi:5-methylcytosine-specific restriction endonuclease McrA